jgi:DNA-binding CsgD family transcriptional regulator
VVPKSQLERTEFYDACRRPRYVDAELGCGDADIDGQIRFLALNRPKGDPPFSDSEKRLLALLYPHLMQALQLDSVLSSERSEAAWTGCTVDRLDDPVIRRDPDGRLRPLNAAGAAFLGSEGIGAWGGNALLPLDPRPSVRGNTPSHATGASGVEKSYRSGHTYRVFSSPCFEEDRFVGDVIRLRLVRRTPVASLPPGTPGFTPHESEVAALLCEGLSSPEICSRLGIGLNTLNTHIRHLFEKTGCHSRAQLIVRLAFSSRGAEGEGRLMEAQRFRD